MLEVTRSACVLVRMEELCVPIGIEGGVGAVVEVGVGLGVVLIMSISLVVLGSMTVLWTVVGLTVVL